MRKKTTRFFICCILIFSVLNGYSQRITYSKEHITMQDFFRVIREQTGFTVFANYSLLENAPLISVKAENKPLRALLDEVLTKNGLSYTIEDKTIVLTAKTSSDIGDTDSEFSGMITDAMGMPLEGVSVRNMMAKKNASTVSDNKGIFKIEVKKGDVLNFWLVGFKLYQYSVTNTTFKPNIVMTADGKDLEGLVVIGYGSAKKKDIAGSISTVDPNSFKDMPLLTVDNALAGKAAGVQVTKSDGTPGGAVRIRVRGTTSLLGGNDPLYVIDGIPIQVQSNYISTGFDVSSPAANDATGGGGTANGISTASVNGLNALNGLNPDDIESLSILKDASATAIYGSKAANGVVIITTKKGIRNMKPRFNVSYYTTVSTPILPKLLNSEQYRMLVTEAAQNSYDSRIAAGRPNIPADIDMVLNHPDKYFYNVNTNWLKEITRNTVSHNAQMSIQGGSANSKYYSSIAYNSTPGVMQNSKFDRITGKINLENNITSRLTINTNLILGYATQNINSGAYAQAIRARPDLTPFDADGNFVNFSTMGASYQGYQNPLAVLNSINLSKTFTLMGNLSASYKFSNNLTFNSALSLDRQTYDQRVFTPSYVSTGGYTGSAGTRSAIGNNANSNLTNWFLENTLTYNKYFNNKSNLNILVGQSYQTTKRSFFSATATGYPDDNYLTSLSSAVKPLFTTGDDPTKPQSYLLSFYLRSNYTLFEKYVFTFTGRADGSSKFGPSNKWGYFPSGAFAWRASNEDFLKRVKWLSDFKLRASYGLTGNQNIGDQMYRTLYTPYNYGGQSALVPTQLGNSGIKWESTKQFDAGTDIAFFDNRLQITVDYYNKITDGALFSLPVAPSSSFSTLLSNAVGLKNTGWELSINGEILHKKDFSWTGSFNISWNKSIVSKLAANASLGQLGNLTGVESGNLTLVQGQPIGLIVGRQVTGIIRTKQQLDDYKAKMGFVGTLTFPYLGIGDPMYTLFSQGTFGSSPDSKVIIGNAAPKYYGGFSQNFSYKKLSLQAYFTYSYGGSLLWADHVSSVEFNSQANANVSMLGRYNSSNTNSNSPRLLFGDDPNYVKSSLDVFRSSYLKLRNIAFSYDLSSAHWSKKVGFSGMSIFASATNLFTITKYPGNDPETSNDPYSAAGGFIDISNYPPIRTYSIGLKASF